MGRSSSRDDATGLAEPRLRRRSDRADKSEMEALLVVADPLVRDLVKVALQQFPGIQVTVGRGHAGVDIARSKRFDCVFVGDVPGTAGVIKLMRHLRSFEQDAAMFVIAGEAEARELSAEKSTYDVHSFLATPLVLKELFGAVARLVERRSQTSHRAAGARSSSAALR